MSLEALLSLSRGHREVIPNLFRTPLVDRGAHIKEAEYSHVILGEKKERSEEASKMRGKVPFCFQHQGKDRKTTGA